MVSTKKDGINSYKLQFSFYSNLAVIMVDSEINNYSFLAINNFSSNFNWVLNQVTHRAMNSYYIYSIYKKY